MRMYKFLLISCFLGVSSLLSFSQSRVADYRSKTEKIKFDKDTVWIINTEYDLYHLNLELNLDFSEQIPVPSRIKWSAQSAWENVNPGGMTHMYDSGLHELQLEDPAGKIYHYMVFNRMLTADFELTPDPFQFCLEVGGDSLLLVKKNFEQNLPETEYEIVVDGPALFEEGAATLFDASEWFGPLKDSVWIVFNHQTGVKPCNIFIRMTYTDEEKNIKMTEETNPQKVSVYRAPNVKKIFDYEEPGGGEIKDVEVCANSAQSVVNLNEDKLNYYQYKKGSSAPVPSYESFAKAKDMEIHYFYTDTLYDGMPESNWKDVSGTDMVSTTSDILFFVPGYYKMMITAKNMCNEVGEIKIDTLWTHETGDKNKKRYFRVYSNDGTKLVCKNEMFCTNVSDAIVIVDYNVRRGYEAPPEYVLTANEYDIKTGASVSVDIWKNGRIVTGKEAEGCGCDSTVISVRLNDKDFYGELNLNVERNAVCSGGGREFKINVGREPKIDTKQLYKELIKKHAILFDGKYYNHCDTFLYQMPIDSLTLPAWERGFALDSIGFYVRQGTAGENPLIYYPGDEKPYQLLDSTDADSYIRIRSYNACGWKEDTLQLRVNARPQVELLRDSVSGNDSLCIGFDYPYYWGGKLPKEYEIYLKSAEAVYVNDTLKAGGVQFQIRNGDTIRHTLKGTAGETFLIQNKNMPSCSQDSLWKVEVLAQPDTLLHPDSVGYCLGSKELETVKLFATDKSDFKWGEWKLNAGEMRKERLPVFNLTGGVDTLRYKLSRSKGCYINGELLLRPQTVPELKLADYVQYCLPDTILSFRKAEMVENISDWNGCNQLSVYENEIKDSKRRYQDTENGPVNSKYELLQEDNGKKFIYEMVNTRVDVALLGNCRLRDTVQLHISSPKLEILKSDVLVYPWDTYDFAHLKTGHFIDTAHLNPATLKWTLRPEGTVCGTGLYGGSYSLTAADKAKDTLMFELSAQSYCGLELKDTLYVEINHLKINGYKDTICSNEEGYALWDKVQWSHVDLTSIRWQILYPAVAPGELSGTSGPDVKYKPGDGTDSVRILFEVALENVPTEKTYDTVVLLINPAPILEFSKDTLWACIRFIKLKEISSEYLHAVHTTGIGRGDYVLEGQSRVGGWSGTHGDYTFENVNLENFSGDLFQKVSYEALGLRGCKSILDTVVLAQPVPAKMEFKRKHEEMCAGDRIKLDTLYTLTGEDPFVRCEWVLASDVLGHIENGYYVANQPEDKIQELNVSTYKEYTCYSGKSSGKVLQTTAVSLPLTVHREPIFNVVHRHDTLCRNTPEIRIERNWVNVEKSLYPDYQDSVRVNGVRLLNDGINYSVNNEDSREKLVVTVAQGRCTKWTKSDTIYLYRLGSMFNGTFSVPDVCEGGQALIDKSNLNISPLASQVKWSADGGTITADNNYFVPNKDVRNAFVHLSANAPHGCGTEKLIDVPVAIGRKPQLQTKEYTVCRLAGHKQQIVAAVQDPTVQVQKIDWLRCGTPDEEIITTGPSEQEWTFTVSAADTLKTEVCLRARIQSGGACQGIFEDTVRIRWQEKPSFSIQPMEICQADTTGVDLQTKVQVTNAGVVAWSLQTLNAGTLTGGLFVPGEYSGQAAVNVTAPGLLGCPDETRTVTVNVKAAPKSGIIANGENCTLRQVVLKPGNNQTTSYDWEFGDGEQASDGVNPVTHKFQTEGNYTILLKAHFDNGCLREETKFWSVHPTPQAMFTLPVYSPINKTVALTSTSLPESVSCHWSVDAANYTVADASHIFTAAGMHQVRLVVTSPEGCTDTIEKSTEVLNKPVADFDVVVDSCAGKVSITNKSVRNEATVAWDFGNGESVSSTWEPSEKSYPLVWQDTLYTIRLTLANVSDTVEYAKTFKMISRLEPNFEIWTSNPCNKTEKEIRILTRGRADTTYIDWGDGSQPQMWLLSNPVNVLEHSYPENLTTASVDYRIKLRSVNTCHRPNVVEKGVSIVPLQVRAKVLEADDLTEYKNKCYGNDRGFWNKSFGFISQGYTCEWDFGDGTPLETDTVSVRPKAHMFARPGEYFVRLRVRDECNEVQDSLKILVHGNDSLTFAFEKDNEKLCTGDSIRIWFVQRGKEPFTNLRWDLPDGTYQKNIDTIYYKFNDPGAYYVSLSAQADGCQENPRPKKCLVQQTPKASVEYTHADVETEGCTPLKIPFKAVNYKGGTDNVRTYWDFGDGSSSIEVIPPAKVFETAGQYTVKLSLESSNGCVSWDSVSVTARITPATTFELEQRLICSNSGNFEITAFNRTDSPDDCTFEWYKGDEVVSMDPVSVTIPFAYFHGKEEIALRAIHKLSQCAYKVNDTIVASWPLKATLLVAPDTICGGMEVIFTDTSTMAGATQQFFFDDGSFEEGREVRKTYWDAGKYTYDFVLTNADGCADTLRDTIFVHTLPLVEFDWKKDNMVTGADILPNPEIESGGMRFTNATVIHLQDWEKDGLRYHWNFGDGNVSEEKEPAHQFANNGSYEVWLHAISGMGCRDSISHLIDIAAIKGLYFPNAIIPASNDPGVNRFQPKGIGLHVFTLKIYAPDGTCVWRTDKLDAGRPGEYWDGTYNGQLVPAGIYNWNASAIFIDGSVQNHINGTVIVIR